MGKEDLTKLTDNEIIQSLTKGYYSVPIKSSIFSAIKTIHFNEKHPPGFLLKTQGYSRLTESKFTPSRC